MEGTIKSEQILANPANPRISETCACSKVLIRITFRIRFWFSFSIEILAVQRKEAIYF